MKPRRLLWTSSALCLLIASCDKPKPAASGENKAVDALAAERAALEDERAALERQRFEEERAALEEEKAALEAERQARLAAREQQVEELDLTLEERQQALADREADLNAREDDLADRESFLSDRELELAGSEALDDWEPEPVADFQAPVADYGTFYDDLQPYGSWFETPDYGYVYQPAVVVQDTSWRPYTRGRWACTNRGWTWMSDEPFGWACFHYGRWTCLAGRGWVWVPGDEWAPSWVCWREGGDHVGWAPLPPETLCYRGRGWGRSVEADFGIGHIHFTFIHCRHMADPIWRHCLPVARNRDCIRTSANITNIRFDRNRIVSGGPRYEKLRALVGKPWPVYQLETDRHRGIRGLSERNARIRGNRLAVFAPNLNTRWNAGLKPQRVAGKWDDVKVVRAESGIKPEWTERFRETRQKQREQAVTWKRDHGGSQEPAKELQANREKVAQAQIAYLSKQRELLEARRAKHVEKRESSAPKPLPGAVAGRPASPDKATGGDAPARRRSLAERQREMTERMRESRARAQAERPQEGPAEPAARPNNRPAPETAGNTRGEREPQPQVTPGREGNDNPVAREEARREPQPQPQVPPRREGNDGQAVQEQARRQQQEQMRQRQEEARVRRQEDARQREEQARQTQERSRNEAEESNRRERVDQQRREQAEQARQQQQDEARERQEQSRRQAEDNQRRQQQEEMRREQQERARQQQEERARQQQEERARQQEQERARQEERMREQQERTRQQEEMQRRQEEARRGAEERARQQQEERARQQEERQRQQEEGRRQQEERQREQQERARQEQDERSRRQQEDGPRQRGR